MKHFKIVASILSIVILSTLLFACKKEKLPEYSYTENTVFGFEKLQNLPTYTGANVINLGDKFATDNMNMFIVAEQSIIIVKNDNGKYGVYQFNGTKLYDVVYDFIDYSFNVLRLYKEGVWTLKNYALNKEVTYTNGTPYALYNNLIAFFPHNPSYSIEIVDYSSYKYFTIYDDQRDKFTDATNAYASNKLVNYGNIIIYKNDQFKTFFAYNIKGEELFSLSAYTSSTMYYLGNNKILHNFTSSSDIWTHRSFMYDISNSSSYTEIFPDTPIVAVYSKQADNCPIADGYRIAISTTGNSYMTNGSLDEEGNLRTKNIFSLTPATREQDGKLFCVDKDNKDKLYIYGADGNNATIINSIYQPTYNGGYVVGGTIVDTKLKFGIFDTNAKLLLDHNYDYLSPVVDGVSYGFTKSASGARTFTRVNIDNNVATATETTVNSISDVTTGMYFSFDKATLKGYNFKDHKLFELNDVSTFEYYTVSDNKALMVLAKKGADSYLIIAR